MSLIFQTGTILDKQKTYLCAVEQSDRQSAHPTGESHRRYQDYTDKKENRYEETFSIAGNLDISAFLV